MGFVEPDKDWKIPEAARFWSKIEIPGDDTLCWSWGGFRNRDGYGIFLRNVGVRGLTTQAHRIAFEYVRGEIPRGLVLDHIECDNPPCVNPYHLKPATVPENTMRSDRSPCGANSRKTHCKHGHEFTPDNTGTYNRASGGRKCLACRKINNDNRYRRA